MIQPPVEEITDKAGGRFNLVMLASRRARQINSYYTQLGGGIGQFVPPQVHSLSHKPLSIAFEEIDADKVMTGTVEDLPQPEEQDTLDMLLSYRSEPMEDEANPLEPSETADKDESAS